MSDALPTDNLTAPSENETDAAITETPAPAEHRAPSRASDSIARGTLTDASLPGTAFHPREFDVELSQTSLAEADELLKSTLDEAMLAVGGNRAFLALIDTLTGELALRFTAGEGWTDDIRRLRVNMSATDREGESSEKEQKELAMMSPAPSGSRRGITRHVVANGRRYWTGDVSKDPYYIGFFDDVKSEVAVPITTRGGGTIGVVNVESPAADAFNEEHANLLSVLARRIAVIVAMAEHQLREEALIAIGKDLNSSSDIDILMEHVVEQATKILRADDCSLFLLDEDTQMLQLTASYGPLGKGGKQHDIRYAPGEGLTGWVVQNGEAIRVGDPRTDPRWKGLFMEAPAGELASVMAVPVRSHRGISGVVRVVRHRKGSLYFLPQEFTQADEDVLVTLAGQLAVAVDRNRLLDRLLSSERMAAWGEMSARSAHMIGNAVFGVKGHLNELTHWFTAISEGELGAIGSGDGENTNPQLQIPQWDDARFLMESITRGIYRLESILGEFRDFVLATQLHATPRDVNQILRSVTAESFPRHSNIDLVLNLAPSLPPVLVDEAKLKRAFSELIENSVDFQPHGGMLTIRTSMAESETLREFARSSVSQPALQIEFIDHGPGLSEQDRQRVFTPFYTRKAKGMGLGLSIVKGIIEAHHGVISEIGDASTVLSRIQSGHLASGTGAHFIIFMPVGVDEKRLNPAERT